MNDDSETRPAVPAENSFDEPDDIEEIVEVSRGDRDESDSETVRIPERLAVLPIRDTVAFPGTVMPLQIKREKSKRVLDMALAGSRLIAVVAQRAAETEDPRLEDLYSVGTACFILKMLKMTDGTETIVVHGLRRVRVEEINEEQGYLEARVDPHRDAEEVTTEQQALVHTVRKAAERILALSPEVPDEAQQVLRDLDTPGGLADFLAANLPLGLVHKQDILETFDVTERLRKVNLAVAAQLDVVELSSKIQEQVRSQVDQSQREYYLRQQMKAIRKELGEQDGRTGTLIELRDRIEKAKMPEGAQTEAYREVDRMEHIPQASPEYGMALDYVEWLVELPWSVSTKDKLDIDQAAKILDEDHYGLDKIKKRILEFLAVRTLRKDTRGPILCFAGPPGVGKTSLGQSIARAMGRKFIRISLGGVHDEAAIRGHRRTYIGSMPGRIIREIRRAGSNNPLFMLDEIDKIAQDLHGDPMSALLEVLDPAQNTTFSDHYLGIPFDLSKVLFITTANYIGAIEPALYDRMEVIELNSYTRHEKLKIARQYLLPRQLEENGLTPEQIEIDDEILALIIADYTREAGVRTLERKIGAVCRARATAIVRQAAVNGPVTPEEIKETLGPQEFESEVAAKEAALGVVTGLAFTAVGGEILFIEATKMPGTGQLNLTGQLGDVMRESAVAASSIIRSRLGVWDVQPGDYRSFDFHVHVPAGAVPKDGPSAGVAILAAMISILTGEPVDPTIGMTGEITLSGRVLPVGGLREKALAAHRAGLKQVIIPARNVSDLEEIAEDIREQIQFVPVDTIDTALNLIFGDRTKTTKKKRKKKTAGKKKAAKAAKGTRKKKPAVKKKTARGTVKKRKRAAAGG